MRTHAAKLCLIGLIGLSMAVFTACDEVVSFSPKKAEWTMAEWNQERTITVQAILARAKFKLTAAAYTDNAYFAKKSTTCESGNTYETGVPGKETCTATIALNLTEERLYKKETGHLIVEGIVEVSGKIYEGREKSDLKAA